MLVPSITGDLSQMEYHLDRFQPGIITESLWTRLTRLLMSHPCFLIILSSGSQKTLFAHPLSCTAKKQSFHDTPTLTPNPLGRPTRLLEATDRGRGPWQEALERGAVPGGGFPAQLPRPRGLRWGGRSRRTARLPSGPLLPHQGGCGSDIATRGQRWLF